MENSNTVADMYKEFNAHLRYKTFWKRFFASWIDGIVVKLLSLFTGMLLAFPFSEYEKTVTLYLALLPFAYTIFLHGHLGQTVGKSFMDIRVVNHSDEEKISYMQAFKRDMIPLFAYLLFLLLSFLPTAQNPHPGSPIFAAMAFLGSSFAIWYVLEMLTMLTNKKRRAIHDFIAGTVVVRD